MGNFKLVSFEGSVNFQHFFQAVTHSVISFRFKCRPGGLEFDYILTSYRTSIVSRHMHVTTYNHLSARAMTGLHYNHAKQLQKVMNIHHRNEDSPFHFFTAVAALMFLPSHFVFQALLVCLDTDRSTAPY